jgi:hypothetical protein
MRNQPTLLLRRLGGPDLQAAVDRYRIATDNLTVELPPESDGEWGFSTPCGTQDDHQQRQWAYQIRHQPGGNRSCTDDRPKPASKSRTATSNRP